MVAIPDPKAAVLQRLRALQAKGLSLQMIANQLNAEGVPTLSSTGRWQKGTIGNLLAQAGNRPHARRAKSAGAVHGKLDLREGCCDTT